MRSAYTKGISATVGASTLTAQEWDRENAQLQKDLKAATAAFPSSFTEKQATELLGKAAAYGQAARKKYGDWLGDVDTRALTAAINAALEAQGKWSSKIPIFDRNAFTYREGQNKEWGEVRSLYLKCYVEAAGVIGQRIVVNEARRELRHDLNPTTPDNLLKIIGITGGALALLIIATRAPRRE